jgi:hypothetical protein
MFCCSYNNDVKSTYFLFVIFLIIFPFACFSQKHTPFSNNTLHPAPDSTIVDSLNQLSDYHIHKEKKDSALFYSLLAFAKANEIDYYRGMGMSLNCQSRIAKHFDDDFIESERLAKAALLLFEKTSNKAGIDTLYHNLIYTVFAQSKFQEAINYTQKLYAYANHKSDPGAKFNALTWLFSINRQSGNYEKSFLYAQQKYDFSLQAKNKIWVYGSLYCIAQLYQLIDDFPNALAYFNKCRQMEDDETKEWLNISDNDIWFKMEFAEVFSQMGQFDSAWHYYNLFRPAKEIYKRVWWVSTGECHLLQKNYHQALQNLQLGLAEHRKLNDQNEVMRALSDIGKAHLGLNNNTKALRYGQEGLQIALQTKAKQYIRDGYQILSSVYDRLQMPDSANFYFRLYIAMKEEVLNDVGKAKFAAYEYEQKIALLEKEKFIHQQQVQIHHQLLRQKSLITEMLIGGIVAILLIGIIILRNILLKRRNEAHRREIAENDLNMQKLESEKTKARLLHQKTELEMQALRAQMNPHFIFNSLNSINRFILQNNRLMASEFLTKFSRLVRLILQNSQAAMITLESELECLGLYLELEALRFNYHFDYKISLSEDLDLSLLKVPPLIIQPYVENAIWHGLMHKEEKGQLDVELWQDGEQLYIKIADNGVGRGQALALKSKMATRHKSMGLEITVHRIAMLQSEATGKSPVTINDLVEPDGTAAGTEVILQLPTIYD